MRGNRQGGCGGRRELTEREARLRARRPRQPSGWRRGPGRRREQRRPSEVRARCLLLLLVLCAGAGSGQPREPHAGRPRPRTLRRGSRPPHLPSRTKWTRLVPPPVRNGHASSTPRRLASLSALRRSGPLPGPARGCPPHPSVEWFVKRTLEADLADFLGPRGVAEASADRHSAGRRSHYSRPLRGAAAGRAGDGVVLELVAFVGRGLPEAACGEEGRDVSG